MFREKGFRIYLLLGVLTAATLLSGARNVDAQTAGVQGRVVNGTTKAPVANAEVQYIVLQQGMTPAAQAKTDRDGRFELKGAAAPASGPALLRVEYQGVTYSKPLLPGQNQQEAVEIEVFDATPKADQVKVVEQAIYLHPGGSVLMVIEQVILKNDSNPPKAYVNSEGTYFFTLPGTPREGVRATIQGAMGMPLPQTPIAQQQPNRFALNYPVRPGETEIRLEYSLEYTEPYEFAKTLDMKAEQTHIVTAGKDVQVSGDSLENLGADSSSGFVGYRITPAGSAIRLQVSGQAPARSAGSTVESAQEAGALSPIPDAVSNRRWMVLALLSLVMAAGFVYLYTR
ncbi:MAG: hypothetical protein HY648_10470 [Acidobacteria bacterium]|nr:hypothetical protein [Acidobacteriota bacterium]